MSGNKYVLIVIIALVILGGVFLYPSFFNKKEAVPEPKRISMLTASDLQLSTIDGLRLGFKDLGLKEGVDFVLELRNPKGDRDVTATMAREIISKKPDVIVSISTSATSAIQEANKEAKIPTVAIDVGNFKQLNIENIQRPGGFITGVVVDNVGVAPKRMEMLKKLLPNLKTIGVIANPKHVSYNEIIDAHNMGGEKLGIKSVYYHATKKEEIASMLEKITKEKPDAIMTTSEAVISGNAETIASALRKSKIPSLDFNIERGVGSGYLMVYGVARFDVGKQSARMVAKVLQGEKPGNIPVEFASPSSFEINNTLAKEINIKIPEALLLQATKVYNE
ncbi:ABC transporter substrate-binding protein [Candidatus Giovannonibacteria bacterium]|nr:ABC transporter substrate-binding protein [Candidatus Giovannonibacteria bacterium]